MIDQALIVAAFAFIESIGMHVPDRNVVVTYASVAELKVLNKGHPASGLCIDGRVYLSDQLDLNSDLGKSIVVHELVHYTQDKCPLSLGLVLAKREAVAYQVQNMYLEHIGSATRVENPYFMALFGSSDVEVMRVRAQRMIPYTIDVKPEPYKPIRGPSQPIQLRPEAKD